MNLDINVGKGILKAVYFCTWWEDSESCHGFPEKVEQILKSADSLGNSVIEEEDPRYNRNVLVTGVEYNFSNESSIHFGTNQRITYDQYVKLGKPKSLEAKLIFTAL
jgi:hypothetical protein